MITPPASINTTVGKYIYVSYWDHVDIRDESYTLFRSYGQFTGRGHPENVIQRVLKYNKRALTSNRPIYAFNMKDTHRLPFIFIEPIKAFASLISVDLVAIAPTKAGMKAFAKDTVLGQLLKVNYKRTCKEIVDGDNVNDGSGPKTFNSGILTESAEAIQENLGDLYMRNPAAYAALAI